MQAVPAFSALDSRTGSAFDALLTALSRPGTLCDLGDHLGGLALPLIVETLLDAEVSAWTDRAGLRPALDDSGARPAPLAEADWLFPTSGSVDVALSTAKAGSDLYPDDAATLVLEAAFGEGAALRLSGPGIAATCDVQIDLPPALWARRAAAARYPMGVDMLIVRGSQVMGLPRSVTVEVL